MIILLNFTEPKMPLYLVLFLKIYLNKKAKGVYPLAIVFGWYFGFYEL